MLVNNHRMCSFMSNDRIDALLDECRSSTTTAASKGGK
jgi:hypothetical protein